MSTVTCAIIEKGIPRSLLEFQHKLICKLRTSEAKGITYGNELPSM